MKLKGFSSRKEMRKNLRAEKKKKKVEFFQRKSQKRLEKVKPTHKRKKEEPGKFVKAPAPTAPRQTNSVATERLKEVTAEKEAQANYAKEVTKRRIKTLKEMNEEEDVEIARLEKQLKLNKRKSKTLPKSFIDSGLDYLLEVCDSDRVQAAVEAEMQQGETEFDEDLALVTGKAVKKPKPKPDEIESDQESLGSVPSDEQSQEEMDYDESDLESLGLVSGEEQSEIEEEMDESDDQPPDLVDIQDEDEQGSEDEPTPEENEGTWEDIYGRLRDKDGNLVKEETKKYVPPHLRASEPDEKKQEELDRLKKKLKGMINRLAENNMHAISNQIEELYMKHSRYDTNSTLFNLFVDAIMSRVATPERLILEHACLLAVLHANVGSEIGAFFIQNLTQKFVEIHPKSDMTEDKSVDNLLVLICHMYTFKIFSAGLIYDLLDKLCDRFNHKDVDLILIVLRTVGFTLRKDDPISLKNFIGRVQKLSNNLETIKNDSRVRFMLDILISIKNNNMSKIPNYDPSHAEHLKKFVKTMFRKGNYVNELTISLEELLKADERGRWWVVGSAWSGPAPAPKEKKTPAVTNSFTSNVLELAKKQRMNTTNRINIFCIIVTAEDYLDAFEKLLRLGLKGQPANDIINVLLHCLLNEKKFNPYYAFLAAQFCKADRKYKMDLQYSLWDKFRDLHNINKTKIGILAKFLAHLFIDSALPLICLKVLDYTDLSPTSVRLLRQTLIAVLLDADETNIAKVFATVSKSPNLRMFRESIRLFLHHFVLKNIKDNESEDAVTLKERIDLVDKLLTVSI